MTVSSAPPTDKTPSAPEVMYCANHPTVETSLRCNNCNKPICPKCARLTETGYRCKECISGQQRVFDTSVWYDYPIAFILAGVLAYLGSLVAAWIGFFIIFVAPIIGVGIAEVVRAAIRKHRSARLYQIAAVGAALGSLVLVAGVLMRVLAFGAGYGILLQLLWLGLYAFTMTSTLYYRLRGITMK
jgi:hypothetical protein